MQQVGFGVMENDKFRGIWPVPLEVAQAAKKRYQKTSIDTKITIVPIYIGAPILETSNERQHFAGKS